jgi:hypothetical protein
VPSMMRAPDDRVQRPCRLWPQPWYNGLRANERHVMIISIPSI